MKKLLLLTAIFLAGFVSSNALEPVRVAFNYTAGGGTDVEVELYDYSSSGTVYSETIGTLSANSSGIITFLVGDGIAAWTNINANTVDGNMVINVKTGSPAALYAQFRLDQLILVQSQTGTGSAMLGGAGAFQTDGGITTAINPNDDFIFGDTDFNYGSGTEYKLFFDNGDGSFRVGRVTTANWDNGNRGASSLASGRDTEASGTFSTAMGYLTTASGSNSTALGLGTTASGHTSTAMGSATASGGYSTAMGFATTASSIYSTAIGINTTASGSRSTAMGNSTTAESYAETVIGSFNTDYTPNSTSSWNTSDRLFVVGNGTSSSSRSDAMVVLKNGNTTVGGDLSVTGTTSYSTGTAIGDIANVITFNSGGASITTADLNANHPNGTVLYLHETSGTGDITDGDGTGISFSFQNIVMVKDGTGTWRIMSFAQ